MEIATAPKKKAVKNLPVMLQIAKVICENKKGFNLDYLSLAVRGDKGLILCFDGRKEGKLSEDIVFLYDDVNAVLEIRRKESFFYVANKIGALLFREMKNIKTILYTWL